MEKKYNDLIGDILERSGEKDNYKGKGKKISKEYLQMDTFQHYQQVANNAGYLPEWLRLQKEISILINECQTEEDVKIINKKIRQYNMSCPAPLQKGLIRLETVDQAKRIW
ncbi:DnaJ family domain-containing protein [Bacillus kwashiorkori]|uniref:DnaJ family domain-containing protein n=1 Tax=Bacillus kwashiorkori TaxID=1522318 RepID=UPI00078449D3|nr:DnaJ family domain-containing protein [Bacillus kwashiorkori]